MEQTDFHKLKKELDDAGVTLVAVSKTKSEALIRELYDNGQRDFGENYVQELTSKQSVLPKDIRWHFIGHLQRNKVKQIVPFIHLIQSVDSEKLIKEINKEAVKNNRCIDILLQAHIAEESTKFGFDEKELMMLLPELKEYPGVSVKGLMGMATFTDDMLVVEKEFGFLQQIFNAAKKSGISKDWNILSMGMSADYEIAIRKGSNMVRIGSLLFGARN